MTCLGDEDVTALLAGRLTGNDFHAAEDHLDLCRGCRLLVSTLAAKTGDRLCGDSLSAFGPGDTVAGRYDIVALLGTGGMGEVYEAFDTVLGERIALKTIGAGVPLDERGISRFKAEVQTARRITHRNICRVFDVGFHTEPSPGAGGASGVAIPFFTMELLAGETLRTRLRRDGPLPCDVVVALLEQIAAGLDAAHAAGVVHRDLKSENVMLVPENGQTRVVITDFGLAHRFAPVGRDEGQSEILAGTLAYMAPEQLDGEPPHPATDIYALGVVLFELLTGTLPYSPMELAAARANAGRKPAPSLRRSCTAPPAWDRAIARCLALSPSARFTSAGELLEALRAPKTKHGGGRAAAKMAVAIAFAAVAGVLIVVRGAALSAPSRRPPPASCSPRPPATSAPISAASIARPTLDGAGR